MSGCSIMLEKGDVMKIHMIVAAEDPQICTSIIELVSNSGFEFELIGSPTSVRELDQLIRISSPDIVITGSHLSDSDCFPIIRQEKNNPGSTTQFLVFGGQSFESVYQAVKAGASDYLIFPIDPGELKASLAYAVDSQTNALFKDSTTRLFYINDQGAEILKNKSLTLEQVNSMYSTNFAMGLFQMLFIKFDFPNSFERINMSNPKMFRQVHSLVLKHFQDICADIILENKSDGIMILLNYVNERHNLVEIRILELYQLIGSQIKPRSGKDLTICVSATVTDPCDVWQIKEQVRDAEWSRIIYGVNKVIFWKPGSLDHAGIQSKLKPVGAKAKEAVESLDTAEFSAALRRFYNLPQHILVSHEARVFVKEIIASIFEMYWDTISEFTDPALIFDEISYYLHLCTTFQRHHTVLHTQCTDLLNNISQQINKKYSPSVTSALLFIKQNIDKKITIEDAAKYVHLSNGYFSFLFKRETGVNFTRFVKDQKNIVACKLLKTTNLNISEVACHIGFTEDVREFSKFFKALNGVTPTMYRQMHKNTAGDVL